MIETEKEAARVDADLRKVGRQALRTPILCSTELHTIMLRESHVESKPWPWLVEAIRVIEIA
jgi:hypothetical protein